LEGEGRALSSLEQLDPRAARRIPGAAAALGVYIHYYLLILFFRLLVSILEGLGYV